LLSYHRWLSPQLSNKSKKLRKVTVTLPHIRKFSVSFASGGGGGGGEKKTPRQAGLGVLVCPAGGAPDPLFSSP
jgi:hypothetical protein